MLIGAAASLSDIFEKSRKVIATRAPFQTQVLSAVIEMLKLYGGVQVRNLACVGGNLVTASPIADMNPILLAARAQLHIASAKRGRRVIHLEQSFFVSYRRVALEPDEVLVSVLVPWMSEDEHFNAYKQARRRDDDISIVSSAFWTKLRKDESSGKNFIEVRSYTSFSQY